MLSTRPSPSSLRNFQIPRFALRSGTTTGARLAAVGALLGLMAVGARRFSVEEFGLWAIIYSLMNFALAGDFGFRYGLGNRLAALRAVADSDDERRETFLAVFHLEWAIGLAGLAACMLGLSLIDWARVFHIQNLAFAAQTQWLFPLVCGLLMLNQPLTMAGSAFFADHQIEFISALMVGQSVLLVAALWLASYNGSFAIVLLIFFGTYLAAGGVITLLLFRRMRWRWSWPPLDRQWAIVRSMSKPSLDFFVLSLSAVTATTAGAFLAGVVGGVQSAGDFSLVQRLFNLLVAIHMAALTPLAPAYTLHAKQGDWEWIAAKLAVTVRVVWPILFVAGGALLLLSHPLLLRIWSGKWLTDYPLAGLLAAAAVLTGLANTYSILLNSLGAVRVQAVLGVVMIIPVIALPLVLGHWFGIRGVALATCICSLPACVVTWKYARHVLDQRYLRI